VFIFIVPNAFAVCCKHSVLVGPCC